MGTYIDLKTMEEIKGDDWVTIEDGRIVKADQPSRPYLTTRYGYNCRGCHFVGHENVCANCNESDESNSNRYYTIKDSSRIVNIKNKYTFGKDYTQDGRSFDQIIMECNDMLSVETEVKKSYEKWLGAGKKPRINRTFVFTLLGIASSQFVAFLILSFIGNSLNSNIAGIVCGTLVSFVLFRKKLSTPLNKKSEPKINDENSKFKFLKESYQGTIQKLNLRLEDVLLRINEQVQAHQRDKKEILENSDLFDNTEQVIEKIDRAIGELRESEEKVIAKQGDIAKTMNEYLGEDGYISQKEKEIERIKKAQEISERMQKNFDTTLEIVKNVDVLTDAIIPGIKQLMEFRIPDLIRDVEFKCDKERVLLEIR